jgi:hypothetical protein
LLLAMITPMKRFWTVGEALWLARGREDRFEVPWAAEHPPPRVLCEEEPKGRLPQISHPSHAKPKCA